MVVMIMPVTKFTPSTNWITVPMAMIWPATTTTLKSRLKMLERNLPALPKRAARISGVVIA